MAPRETQDAAERCGLLAFAPPLDPKSTSKRSVDFDIPYQLINSTHSRRWNVVDNVPVSKTKLLVENSRAVMRVEEKNVDLLIELLSGYCPSGGLVLDAYAGTLTTALACIETSRKVIAIEKDKVCFQRAMGRVLKQARERKRRTSRSERVTSGAGATPAPKTVTAGAFRRTRSLSRRTRDTEDVAVDLSREGGNSFNARKKARKGKNALAEAEEAEASISEFPAEEDGSGGSKPKVGNNSATNTKRLPRTNCVLGP